MVVIDFSNCCLRHAPPNSHPNGNENRKDNVPITTRQLEALIRLSQARAKACLRSHVIREDAEDVIELMIESVRQVHTDEGGIIDKGARRRYGHRSGCFSAGRPWSVLSR